MKRYFKSIDEPLAAHKWQKLFYQRWPAYKVWLEANRPTTDLKTALAALSKYMPEMVPLHSQLCALVEADPLASIFLTGFQPPTYLSSCSQAVSVSEDIGLIRNYDYHLNRFEGVMIQTAWHGKKVIASSDCLMGVLDGMNEDGLAVSLSFGGRQVVGYGFGIPFILRYVLEFCSTVPEAVKVLQRVPSHMSYNITLADKSGAYYTVQISPDRKARVAKVGFATNHQGNIELPADSYLTNSRERAAYLDSILKKGYSIEDLAKAFLEPPLYNPHFASGFGTLYTAVYRPLTGLVEFHWPNKKLIQSFEEFTEGLHVIHYYGLKTTSF